jgi:hypothetical protein
MAEKEDAILALSSTYEALRAEAIKANEGPDGPLRLQCKQILDQINKLSGPVSIKIKIDTPDLPKAAGAWQLWKIILACTVAAPVALVMILLLYGISNGNSPESKAYNAQYRQEKELWEQAYAACKIQNPNSQYDCKDKLVASGMKYPYQ